ncbi:MAG: TetR/AcrR family transcriptional regulator [Treponema sp.]|nr:TetR/AcrR family transcriptional regulator [Treponema sp.]
MSKKNISQEKIIQAFLSSAFDKSAGATSLADVADSLEIKKASLYNHFESREAMYSACVEYCKNQIGAVDFLVSKIADSITDGKTTIQAAFKKLISRYFALFDSEPLFKMYVFVHSEQYFNAECLKIVQSQTEKMAENIRTLFDCAVAVKAFKSRTDKEAKDLSLNCTSLILQQLDAYIAVRKETVRLNPETGAGSLFELPSDNNIINRTVKLVEGFLNLL